MKLSRPQLEMLRRLARYGSEPSPTGHRDSGRQAVNWLRTVAVLERLGLVYGRRDGDWETVKTPRGGSRRVWSVNKWRKPYAVELALPAPAFVYDQEGTR